MFGLFGRRGTILCSIRSKCQVVKDSVYFWQSFERFLTRKTCTQKKMHVNRHTQFKIWHVVWLVKGKNHMSIDMLEIEMTPTTSHARLRWHFRRKYRCQLTFVLFYENVTWHFGFEFERQMRFVKHAHCLRMLDVGYDKYFWQSVKEKYIKDL